MRSKVPKLYCKQCDLFVNCATCGVVRMALAMMFTLLLYQLPASAQLMKFKKMKEYQLTFGRQGHTLNQTQCFSWDGKWLVYDARNDDTQIGSTCCIEKINLKTAAVTQVYQTKNQTLNGPGVGAASYSPCGDKVIFIHGLQQSGIENYYGITRRTGVIVDGNNNHVYPADARDVIEPFTKGALRGGTHAHSWSGDGEMISFTYNDAVIEQLSLNDPSIKDLRTVGVMQPGKTIVQHSGPANTDGEYFAAVVVKVTEKPMLGTDEVEKAFDETWIGRNGYIKSKGGRQQRAIAFQGNVRDREGKLVTEVFVADLPSDITNEIPGEHLQGKAGSRPNPPLGSSQRRVTFTTGSKYPGIQGPRHWLRSSADGQLIFFLMKDDFGIVQVFNVPTNGGQIHQVTHQNHSVQSGFSLSPDNKYLSYAADNSVFVTDISSGTSKRMTERTSGEYAPFGGFVWSYDGKTIAYNRFVKDGDEKWLQIFILKEN